MNTILLSFEALIVYITTYLQHEAGSRVILDAILLELAEIASDKKMHVDIIPEMRVHGPADGIQITNPSTGYELWLGGVVDYVLVKFGDLERNIGELSLQVSELPHINLFRVRYWPWWIQNGYVRHSKYSPIPP